MKKYAYIFLLSLLLSAPSFGQYTIRESNAIPLHGEWSFTLDPGEMGLKGEWYSDKVPTARFDKVSVPHSFSVDPRYGFYTGTVWYRKSFPWQPERGKRVILHFDAAYYMTNVWLNNQKVGRHEGGYTPFHYDITDYLKSGENLLAVSVNNDTWKPGTVPGAKDNNQPNDSFMGWMNYGGLNRPVYLTVEPEVYAENIKVEATPDLSKGTAALRVRMRVRNTTGQQVSPETSYQVYYNEKPLALNWKSSTGRVAPGQTAILEAEATVPAAQVHLWGLDSPNLYQIKASLPGDTLATHFGIRKVEVRNTQLLLNGQPIKVGGGNRVVDYPGLGSMEPDWLIEKDFKLMKEAGMELQRLTHYTPSELFYDLADRYGMLIITEAGNWQLTPTQMDTDSIRKNFKNQFREMAERDWNHPSVIAYSVGNEYLSEQPAGQRWTKDMIAYARELDPTRLYTFATMRLNILPKKPEDEASQYVDFVSTNTYGNHAKVLDHIHQLYPNKPIFISEWGRRADTQTGEAGQVEHLRDIMKEVRSRPYVVGASWWTYNDYQSRFHGTNANGYRPWGIVGPDRAPRQVYPVYQQEMSPVTVERVRYTPGVQGLHQLVLRVKTRADFPAYPVANYTLTAGDTTLPIPDLHPGGSTEIVVPVRGFEKALRVKVVKPTGFVSVEQTIELKEKESAN
ncbi:glycoside hydrolase family 2 protein [Telluribacter sp. SYSU D00476]|uniref:glycoside hydrolase family 2 protein n=1 Tax=Telluribacter sp. SYSU D00476 TaxID=2811430 RepID=UPI001FF678C1|nr:glycoside hydrolase family 2 TIM barrel-domain containing protein [Telluribacter sp. SYSU D00476]